MEYADLSVDEIQHQLNQIEQSRADLEKALEQRRQQAKYELAEQIKGLILGKGYEIPDIVALLGTRKRRGVVAPPKKNVREYVKYVDPDNPRNVYVRGVIPGWMKQRMLEQGYDSGSRQDREAFKANFLHVRED